jgi:DNA mismatch repair protein MutS
MVKGIVKRGVTELVTPGVTFNDQVLNSKRIISCFHKEKRNTELLWLIFLPENFW